MTLAQTLIALAAGVVIGFVTLYVIQKQYIDSNGKYNPPWWLNPKLLGNLGLNSTCYTFHYWTLCLILLACLLTGSVTSSGKLSISTAVLIGILVGIGARDIYQLKGGWLNFTSNCMPAIPITPQASS